MAVVLNNEQVVASHTHSVSSQSRHATNSELTTVGESGYTEILDSDIADHAGTGNITVDSSMPLNGHSPGNNVAVPTVDKTLLR